MLFKCYTLTGFLNKLNFVIQVTDWSACLVQKVFLHPTVYFRTSPEERKPLLFVGAPGCFSHRTYWSTVFFLFSEMWWFQKLNWRFEFLSFPSWRLRWFMTSFPRWVRDCLVPSLMVWAHAVSRGHVLPLKITQVKFRSCFIQQPPRDACSAVKIVIKLYGP